MDNKILFTALNNDELVNLFLQCKTDEFYALLFRQAAKRGLEGNIWPQYLADLVLSSDHVLAAQAAVGGKADSKLRLLAEAELKDIAYLAQSNLPQSKDGLAEALAAAFPATKSNTAPAYKRMLDRICLAFSGQNASLSAELWDFYTHWGCGDICRYGFFCWDGGLKGVDAADTVTLDDLIGYGAQKAQLLANTKSFIKGGGFNNILLYGERGTGKSSMVKAVANVLADSGLGLVSLPRYSLAELPKLIDKLSGLGRKFIVFLDDLSFDASDREYKYIKSYIEGGAAVLPTNIVLYATSNRRHLIAEGWRDRESADEDVFINDTQAEKLSLSDRFGVTISFPPLDQEDYLAIVRALARQEGIIMDEAALRREAILWQTWQNSRSGRTARQFINRLLVQDD